MSETILEIQGLRKFYPVRGGVFSTKTGEVQAVRGVSFALQKGETLGLVGESGCGKSTLARLILRLEKATAGTLLYRGKDLTACSRSELFRLRREIQIVFQDPYSSLNPRLTIGEILREPLDVHRVGTSLERRARVAELLESVGLSAEMVDRYPHEFSGGQRQRIGVARALALKPEIIIADEPVSALDVSVQAQVINLMVSLQRKLGLTYLFISHDLSVVEYIADSIAIMYLGKIVETGRKETIFQRPAHPYTRALIQAVPAKNPRFRHHEVPVKGETPSPVRPPSGCAFHPRCSFAVERCRAETPTLELFQAERDGSHQAACFRKDEI